MLKFFRRTRFAEAGFLQEIKDFEGLNQDTVIQAYFAQFQGLSVLLGQIHQEAENDVMAVVKQIEKELQLD
jgi:hypothetical protein